MSFQPRMGFQPRLGFQKGVSINACKDKNGDVLTDEIMVLNRWAQHFQYLLNEDEIPTDQAKDIQSDDEDSEIIPTLRDVRRSIRKLKNNRAPGDDNITAELLKYAGEDIKTMMLKIIHFIWKSENVTEGLVCRAQIPIHKKGDKTNCDNYRGIILLNTT